MRRKNKQADFFDPYKDLIIEAEIFCHHADSNDWFWYTYGMTIREAITGVTDKIAELEMIRMSLTQYTDVLLEQLEGYEEYEWCLLVKKQMRKIYHEIFALQMRIEKLDK